MVVAAPDHVAETLIHGVEHDTYRLHQRDRIQPRLRLIDTLDHTRVIDINPCGFRDSTEFGDLAPRLISAVKSLLIIDQHISHARRRIVVSDLNTSRLKRSPSLVIVHKHACSSPRRNTVQRLQNRPHLILGHLIVGHSDHRLHLIRDHPILGRQITNLLTGQPVLLGQRVQRGTSQLVFCSRVS